MPKEFQVHKGVKPAAGTRAGELTIYALSSSRNDWNCVRLSNLIGTKITMSCF
jgi:hypothetical protein